MKTLMLSGAATLTLAVVLSMATTPAHAVPAKNTILMIADGAGYNTLEATRFFTGKPLIQDGPAWRKTAMSVYPLRTDRFKPSAGGPLAQDPSTVYVPSRIWDTTPVAGNSTVPGFTAYPAGFAGYEYSRASYPDSANTASSMVNGVKSYNNAVNVDGAEEFLTTLPQAVIKRGRSAGAVSTVQFSDATPAATGGAHNVTRANRQAIANEMFSAGLLSVIGGTGNPDFTNDGTPRTTPDYAWISPELWNDLKNGTNLSGYNGQNWTMVQDRASIQAIASGGTAAPAKLAMIAQAFLSTQNNRDLQGADKATYVPFTTPFLPTSPTLSELTLAALAVLAKDPDGFYLSSEGGAVDRAMHDNNLGRMIEEQVDFENAVKAVVDWVNRPDTDADWSNTLLIVTADHDHNLYGPDGATVPFQPLIDNGPGNLPGHRWFGPTHSNNLVPLFALGNGADQIMAMADQYDSYTDAQGRTFGRGSYTDQTELGNFLIARQVPEPTTLALLGVGLIGLVGLRRSRS